MALDRSDQTSGSTNRSSNADLAQAIWDSIYSSSPDIREEPPVSMIQSQELSLPDIFSVPYLVSERRDASNCLNPSKFQESCRGDQPGEKIELPKEIAQLISTLRDSDDSTDRAVAAAIEKMFADDKDGIDQHKEQDAKTIFELLKKNKAPLDKEAILAVLTRVDYLGARHAILELNSAARAPQTIKLIAEWLKSDKQEDIRVADSLAFLFASGKPEHKKLSSELIKMLENPDSRKDAITFLKAPFPMTLERVSIMIELNSMGTDKETQTIKELLSSSKGEDVATATAMLELFNQDYCLFVRCVDGLAGPQRERIAAAVRAFDSPDYVEQLLDLMEDPVNHKAIDAMIGSPRATSEVLLLAGSGHEPDRVMATKLLKLLGGDDNQRMDAFNLLTISDFVKRQTFLDLLGNPDTVFGTRMLFEMRDSSDRKERAQADEMLDFVSFRGANRLPLLKLLGTDKALAEKLFATMGEADVFGQAMTMLESKEGRGRGLALLKLAGSGEQGLKAAKIIAELRENEATFERILSEIGSSTPDETAELAKIIARIGSPIAVQNFIKMKFDPMKRLTANQLSKELLSDSAQDQKQARKLIVALSLTEVPGLREATNVVIELRKDTKTKALADIILNAELPNGRFDNVLDRVPEIDGNNMLPSYRSILRIHKVNSPTDPGLKEELSKIANDDPKLVEALVLNFDGPEIRKFVDIYNDPKKATAATLLRFMLIEKNAGPERLLSMLTGTESDRKQAEELLSMLNVWKFLPLDPKAAVSNHYQVNIDEPRERNLARRLLNCDLSREAMMLLKADLEGEDERKQFVAHKIIKVAIEHSEVRENLEKIYKGLSSKEELVRIGAEKFYSLLESDQATAIELLRANNTGVPSWAAIFEVANTPQKIKAVLELFRMRTSPSRVREEDQPEPPQPKISAAKVLEMINGPATRDDAAFVVQMLAKPETTNKAIRLLEVASRGMERGARTFIEMMSKLHTGSPKEIALAKALDQMLSNPTFENMRGLDNLSVLTSADEYGDPFMPSEVKLEILRRILNPEQQGPMLTMLSKLPSPRACLGLMKIEIDPKYREANKVLAAMAFGKDPIEAIHTAAFLEEASFRGLGFSPEVEWLIDLLNKADTRDFAQTLLAAAERASVLQVEKMYRDENNRPMLHDLVKMGKGTALNRDRLTTVLEQSPEEMKTLYSLLQNKETKEFGNQIIDLFSEDGGAQMSRVLLLGLGNTKPLSIDYAKSLLTRYRATEDERERRLLRSLATTNPNIAMEIDKKINTLGMETAREFILELANFASLAAIEELEMVDLAKAREAWRMMNDPRYRTNAFRLLGFDRR